jgi:hypothetical protein
MHTPTPVEPVYRTMSANSPIALGTYRVTLLRGDRRGPEGDATFSLRLSPSPRPVCAMHFPSHIRTEEITAAEIPALSARFAILRPPDVTYNNSGTALILRPSRIELFQTNSAKLREVIFHVINFHNFHPGKNTLMLDTVTSKTVLARVLLQASGWRVTIQALPETYDLVRSLDNDGGYAITHVGKIERVRGGWFTTGKAREILEILRLYLSFARGSFVLCTLAVGSDRSGVCWKLWSSHIAYPWRSYPGWFSALRPDLLEESFPGFFALFENPHWRTPLREILYWYLRSNNSSEGGGVDGGIILAQAALEQLAWIYLVKDKQIISANAFKSKSWPTAASIYHFLEHMKIQTKIPTQLRALRRIAKKKQWPNGPTAIVKVRNELVHPEKAQKASQGQLFGEGWLLAQRYIELAILRLAEYDGHYSDRISAKWSSETTKVPWA